MPTVASTRTIVPNAPASAAIARAGKSGSARRSSKVVTAGGRFGSIATAPARIAGRGGRPPRARGHGWQDLADLAGGPIDVRPRLLRERVVLDVPRDADDGGRRRLGIRAHRVTASAPGRPEPPRAPSGGGQPRGATMGMRIVGK